MMTVQEQVSVRIHFFRRQRLTDNARSQQVALTEFGRILVYDTEARPDGGIAEFIVRIGMKLLRRDGLYENLFQLACLDRHTHPVIFFDIILNKLQELFI